MENLLKAIDTSIDNFINNIIKTYSIPNSEKKNILKIWNTNRIDKNDKLTSEIILKSNKNGLKTLCRKYKLKVTGNKEILIKRLINYMNIDEKDNNEIKKILKRK